MESVDFEIMGTDGRIRHEGTRQVKTSHRMETVTNPVDGTKSEVPVTSHEFMGGLPPVLDQETLTLSWSVTLQ